MNKTLLSCVFMLASLCGLQAQSWLHVLTDIGGTEQTTKGVKYYYTETELFQHSGTTGIRFAVALTTYYHHIMGGGPTFALGELMVLDADGNRIDYTPTSNADHNTMSNSDNDGDGLPALNDGRFDNYFHSVWSGNNFPTGYHYIELELERPVDEFKLAWTSRPNNAANRPSIVCLTPAGESYIIDNSSVVYDISDATSTVYPNNAVWNKTYYFSEAVNGVRLTFLDTHMGWSGDTGNFPMVALGEIKLYDENGAPVSLEALNLVASHTEYQEGFDSGVASLVDGVWGEGDGVTAVGGTAIKSYYHSPWSTAEPQEYIYIDITFPKSMNIFTLELYSRDKKTSHNVVSLFPKKIAVTEKGRSYQSVAAGNVYMITSADDAFFQNQGVTKSLYVSSDNELGWNTTPESPTDSYLFELVESSNRSTLVSNGAITSEEAQNLYHIRALGAPNDNNYYIGSINPSLEVSTLDVSTEAGDYIISPTITGAFNLKLATLYACNCIHANEHNEGSGVSGNVVYWESTVPASQWNLVEVETLSGTCGDNLSWSFDAATGKLTIEGDGTMYNYDSYSSLPWKDIKGQIKSVDIKNGVTSIGSFAFAACIGLTSIVIPETITQIGESAFYGCSSLTSVKIPENITQIGGSAFYGCISLTSVKIPENITKISELTFYGCSSLTSIVIPERVTTIGDYAFEGCSSLTSVVIPAGVTKIGSSVFKGSYRLQSITVDTNNSVYDSREDCNAIIETATNTLIQGCKNSVIPSSVTSIGFAAFAGCSSLRSLIIPSNVISIGDYAFYCCSGLTSIVIPESVSQIGDWTFRLCTHLTSVVIPKSVSKIGGSAFLGCYALTKIISSISAEDLFIPNTDAFYLVDNEACTLYVPVGAKATYAATEGWKEFKNIVELGGHCGDNVYWSLDETTGLLTINGTGAMYNYSSYGDVPWFNIGEQIKSLDIKSGVTSIGDYAFWGCTSLTSLAIPSSVTYIGREAFYWCYGLTSIEIPSNVSTIGDEAFLGCKFESITVDVNNSVYDSREDCNAIIETASNTLIQGCDNSFIPNTVTTIGKYAFWSYSDLTEIIIPSSVTSIGFAAFAGCYGLTEIIIPSSVTTIGDGAFWGCDGLTEIIIPSSVTTIGDEVFYACSSLTSIAIPSSVTSIGNGAFGYCDGLTEIVSNIPADDLFILGDDAFEGIDKEVCTLYVPEGAKDAYAATWQWCDFTNIVERGGQCGDNVYYFLNETTGKLTIFGNGAMWDYHVYQDVPWYSFNHEIKSVNIKSNVTSIGYAAFVSCYSLTSIEIPSNVTSIDECAFFDCCSLENITVDANNSYYDSRENCNAIIETTTNTLMVGSKNSFIPNTVTSIGYAAFLSCYGLTSIEIPSSVTNIDSRAFSSCDRLTEIYSYIPADKLFTPGYEAFKGIDKEVCTLYVPAGAKATYASTKGWKDFKNIVELTNEITINDGEAYTATEAQEYGKIIYNRTFNNTGWQAWYVPFAINYNVLKEDFDVAEINDIHMYDTDDDGTLDSSTLEIISVKSGTLQANYPYFIRAKESGKKSIVVENTTLEAAQSNYIDCSSVKFKYYFIGTTTGVSGSEMYNNKYYAMSGGSMKYAQNESVSLKPFRWYMKVEARSGAALPKEVRIRHIDDITNVEEIEAVAEDNIYYDLSGRRVENPTKGIYILNGKKVFVK